MTFLVAVLITTAINMQSVVAQGPPQLWYTTHDNTATSGEAPFAEFGADAKTAGDGLTCTVSTIEVQRTDVAALYSGRTALPSAFQFNVGPGLRRQVVIIQRTVAAQPSLIGPPNQDIGWQRYFNGFTSATGPDSRRATNARGISVWPGATDADTRIAICGETYDEVLPLSQVTGGGQAPVPLTPRASSLSSTEREYFCGRSICSESPRTVTARSPT